LKQKSPFFLSYSNSGIKTSKAHSRVYMANYWVEPRPFFMYALQKGLTCHHYLILDYFLLLIVD